MADENKKAVNGVKVGLLTILFAVLFAAGLATIIVPFFIFLACFGNSGFGSHGGFIDQAFVLSLTAGAGLSIFLGYKISKAICTPEPNPYVNVENKTENPPDGKK